MKDGFLAVGQELIKRDKEIDRLKAENKAKDNLLSGGIVLKGDGLDALQSMASVKFMVSACCGSLTPTDVAESINGILAKAKEQTEQALKENDNG